MRAIRVFFCPFSCLLDRICKRAQLAWSQFDPDLTYNRNKDLDKNRSAPGIKGSRQDRQGYTGQGTKLKIESKLIQSTLYMFTYVQQKRYQIKSIQCDLI
jgi:hypothetical protein